MLLSAALIVRNESAHLDRCLMSVSGLVDEVVVVDTGSNDDTVAIAERHNAVVAHEPWRDDFATPRNRSLDLASGSWILYLDADEQVHGDHAALREMLAAANDHVAFRVRFIPRVGWTPFLEYRLFRNLPEIRFRRRMHESMLPAIRDVADRDRLLIADTHLVTIEHFGYEGDQTQKHARDEPLLLAALEEQPDRTFVYDHLARIHESRGSFDQAVAMWKRGIEVARARDCVHPDDRLVYVDLIVHLVARGKTGDELELLIAEALGHFPNVPSLEFAAATNEFATGRAARAGTRMEWLTSLTLDDLIRSGSSYDERVVGEWAWNLLGLCRFELGDDAGAASAFRRAEEAAPGNPAYGVRRRLAEARAAGAAAPTQWTATRAARPDRVAAELARMLRPDAPPSVSDPACGWDALLTMADDHRLLPALWSRLVARGVQPLPAPLRRPDSALAILQAAYAENAARIADLCRQGETLLCALDSRDVDAIPLKGMHWLFAGWLPDPAARVMVDIDILVPAKRAATAVAVASGHNYQPVAIDDPEGMANHEVITLMAVGRAGSVEIQVAPLIRRYDAVLPVPDLLAGVTMIDRGGRAQKIPNPTHAMTLTIAHAQLQDECHRLLKIPLRALHDVALVVTNEQVACDWDEVTDRFARSGHARALAGFAAAADELFEVALPVSRRGGHRWVSRTRQAARHPRLAHRYGEIVTIPRALSSARMTRLYDARGPMSRSTARVRHVVRGLLRRLTGQGRR